MYRPHNEWFTKRNRQHQYRISISISLFYCIRISDTSKQENKLFPVLSDFQYTELIKSSRDSVTNPFILKVFSLSFHFVVGVTWSVVWRFCFININLLFILMSTSLHWSDYFKKPLRNSKFRLTVGLLWSVIILDMLSWTTTSLPVNINFFLEDNLIYDIIFLMLILVFILVLVLLCTVVHQVLLSICYCLLLSRILLKKIVIYRLLSDRS